MRSVRPYIKRGFAVARKMLVANNHAIESRFSCAFLVWRSELYTTRFNNWRIQLNLSFNSNLQNVVFSAVVLKLFHAPVREKNIIGTVSMFGNTYSLYHINKTTTLLKLFTELANKHNRCFKLSDMKIAQSTYTL